MMRIERLAAGSLALVEPLRTALWPESPIAELEERAEDVAADPPGYLVLLARSADGEPAGFAEVSRRSDYVNGCEGSPVAFLEGIYVAPAYRRQGVARALVAEARAWTREQGIAELASDALLDNRDSHAFHRAIGFEETERVVYFRMADI